ncbi:MAG TPA: hypothetical protein VF753_14705 [Terriglobales bacterium]
MSRFQTAIRLTMARMAFVWLAILVAMLRANSGTPNLTTWRDEQWETLRNWALNPEPGENINLGYGSISTLLGATGVPARLFTANLWVIAAVGILAFTISLLAARRFVNDRLAASLEVDFGPTGYLVFCAISFPPIYAFLVFLTAELMKS